MSRRKRRKVVHESENASNLSLSQFKEDVVSHFTPLHYKLECEKYISIYSWRKRKKLSKTFRVETDTKTNFRRMILYSGKEEISSMFKKMKPSERIEEIKSFGKYEEYILKKLLERLKFGVLKKLLKDHFPNQKQKGGKVHLINEIADRWFNRSGEVQKRAIEQSNLESLSNEVVYQHVIMCHQLVPRDVIIHIFSYYRYGKRFLFKFGPVCKSFYLIILSSWPSVIIRSHKVYQYSLLVLRSVRTVIIKTLNDKENFRNQEMSHLFSQLRSKRLKKIIFNTDMFHFVKILKYMSRMKDKTCFENVTDFKYKSDCGKCVRKKESSALESSWSQIRLSTLFPRLEFVFNPLKLEILEGCRLKFLVIDVTERICSNYHVFESIRTELSPKKLPRYGRYSLSSEEEEEDEEEVEEREEKNFVPNQFSCDRLSISLNKSDIGRYRFPTLFHGIGDVQSLHVYVKVAKFRDYGLTRFEFHDLFGNISSLTDIVFSYDNNTNTQRTGTYYPIIIHKPILTANIILKSFANLETIDLYHKPKEMSIWGEMSNGISLKDTNIIFSLPNVKNLFVSVLVRNSSRSTDNNDSEADRSLFLQYVSDKITKYECLNIEMNERNYNTSFLMGVVGRHWTVSAQVVVSLSINNLKHPGTAVVFSCVRVNRWVKNMSEEERSENSNEALCTTITAMMRTLPDVFADNGYRKVVSTVSDEHAREKELMKRRLKKGKRESKMQVKMDMTWNNILEKGLLGRGYRVKERKTMGEIGRRMWEFYN